MNEHDNFLKQYLRLTAREGDTILFQPPSWFLCDATPDPAGFVAGTLVSWDMNTVTLHICGSKRCCQGITIPFSWVRGFPLHLSRAAGRDPASH
jgi:hypothetical protein